MKHHETIQNHISDLTNCINLCNKYGMFATATEIEKSITELSTVADDLKMLQSRIVCDNCQQWNGTICVQNGCNDFDDWLLWSPKDIKCD